MMQSGHCNTALSHFDDEDRSPDHDKAGMTCCISMCMAVAVTPAAHSGL